MTDPATYTPEQAFARSLLITAVNGGINHWARVHGYTVAVTADQIRAEGIDTTDRSVWHVNLADLQDAITRLIEHPEQCGDPGSGVDTDQIHSISETLADARDRQLTDLADIHITPERHTEAIHRVIADVVVQVAVAAEVIH